MELPSFNLEALAKSKLEAVEKKVESLDLDHNGKADLAEAKALVDEGIADIKLLEAKVTPAEIAFALNVLFPGKFSAAEVSTLEAAIDKVATGIQKGEALLAKLPEVL